MDRVHGHAVAVGATVCNRHPRCIFGSRTRDGQSPQVTQVGGERREARAAAGRKPPGLTL
eukprot:scaffold5756_cov123-Isochrysis_galbana.AAC.6